MKYLTLTIVLVLVPICGVGNSEEVKPKQSEVLHPERYLRVLDFSYYFPSRVAIFTNFKIENTASIPYKDIRVKAYYISYQYGSVGQIVSSTSGVLPITVPPNSTETYLRGGIPLGAGSQNYIVKYVEVLGATPVLD